jgi:hypothetical protein
MIGGFMNDPNFCGLDPSFGFTIVTSTGCGKRGWAPNKTIVNDPLARWVTNRTIMPSPTVPVQTSRRVIR